MLGTEILVDPATVVAQILGSGQSVQYPLPLPNDADLVGLTLMAQSVHIEANNQLTTSRGLENVGGGAASHGVNGTPAITLSTPAGPAAGNAIFVMTGENLDGATVTINGVPLTSVIANSPTSLAGYTPAGPIGPAVVVVQGATGCSTTTTYTYN